MCKATQVPHLATGKHRWLERSVKHVLEALSPMRCVACEQPGSLLCNACCSKLIPIESAGACPYCGAPAGALLCTECRGVAGVCERVLAAVTFEGVAARLVKAYKDEGERPAAELIAGFMYDALEQAAAHKSHAWNQYLARCNALSFVPATRVAYARRGFDHMEAIATWICHYSNLELADTLIKLSRGDQRMRNRAERLAPGTQNFKVEHSVENQHILLIDDVLTTGATLNRAAQCLIDAGAASVVGLVFARVW
ncbi:ComF family protein [Collinsella sp. zg1085]|uniref:ComF family protein n=1 Tax=Collinsella sp. zg1085 TaxID=2844380 RepID=UPI001C0B060A|nr:phosphoribosyltransferase family protein [Collinsella sp. zg1085]QWT17370.1 ComF family protein [Collinsella sp. zg1085]